MNFLAHEFLSQKNKELRVGNFLADFIRGNDLEKYPKGIKKGVLLHRKIDSYTDSPPVVNQSKKRIYPFQRKYTAVVMDIYYDYLLAKNWGKFSNENLKDFASSVYDDFDELQVHFPEKVVAILPNMRKNDWFYNYQFYWGIEKALLSIEKRAHYSNNIGKALLHLQENEKELEQDFLAFFPDLIQCCEDFILNYDVNEID